jgi:hypothetical protein
MFLVDDTSATNAAKIDPHQSFDDGHTNTQRTVAVQQF